MPVSPVFEFSCVSWRPRIPIFVLPPVFRFPWQIDSQMSETLKNRKFQLCPNRFFIDGFDQISTPQVYLTPVNTFFVFRSPGLVISISRWRFGSVFSGLLPDSDRPCPKFLTIVDKSEKIKIFHFPKSVLHP